MTVEDSVFLGPHMVFTNDLRPRSKAHDYEQVKTTVRKGATVGANATLVGGVAIGRYAMVGAGTVVTKDVPDHALVFGNPAKLRGWVCACGEKLLPDGDKAECVCGKKYSFDGNKCEMTN